VSFTPRQMLFEEFRRRQAKNPRYSLRAFARYLDLPPGRLSQYISGKRIITARALLKICDRLKVSPDTKAELLTWIGRAKKASSGGAASDKDFFLIDEGGLREADEIFWVIAEWEHFAILSLIRLKGQKHDVASLARRLGVRKSKVEAAVARMCSMGLLGYNRGRLVRTHEKIRTSDGVSSRALRIVHRDILEQAISCLERTPLELRSITSITMPVSTRRLPEAIERIKAFRRSMSEFFECADADEVYNLNVQLVPVTKVGFRK